MPNETAVASGKPPRDAAVEIMEREFVHASVGNVGLVTYPGQSPEEVLAIAGLLESELAHLELDLDHYAARMVARRVLAELERLRRD